MKAVRKGAFADRALDVAAESLEEADRRLAQETVLGVLRLRGRLDHIINALVKGGVGGLDDEVLDALRLGAYQLLELDRVPAYAAVSEAVEMAKRAAGRGAASLTNAVLRRLSGSSYNSFAFPALDEAPLEHLSSWGSHPRWLIERWLDRWPVDSVRRLVEYNNRRPAVYVSVAGDKEKAIERLRQVGVEAEVVEGVGSSLRVDSAAVQRALATVGCVVQDPAAATVVDYMALAPTTGVVDMCAAPGGKAALLAMRGHEVWAMDVARPRLVKLLETRARLGLPHLHAAQADGTRPPIRGADAVLLDVPCSGTGTLGRHPDGRWRLRRSELDVLVDLQRRLLDAAAEIVRPGGLLVYATCSLEREENEGQVEAFVSRRREFQREPGGTSVRADLLDAEGDLVVLPQRDGMDGAYAARLRRSGG